jgi:uncharacterized protein YqgC (DUF456 family)
MVSAVAVLAFVLLVAGVVGSLVPKVPGPVLSLSGVYLYWWNSGMTEPSALLLGVLTVAGGLVVVGGFFEEVIAARIGGASTRSAVVAGVVGFAAFFVLGPIAMVLGTAVTVFVLEYRRQRTARAGATAALAVLLATIGSMVIQFLFAVMSLVVVIGVSVF